MVVSDAARSWAARGDAGDDAGPYPDALREQVEAHLARPALLRRPARRRARGGDALLAARRRQAHPAGARARDGALARPRRRPRCCRWPRAIELIHTYSLIHDDLPAMDDDELRRGRPTCHVRFGEDVAILAGDALYAEAFRLLLGAAERRARRACWPPRAELAGATGVDGMVGGQFIDVREAAPAGDAGPAPPARAEDRAADRRERRVRLPARGPGRRARRALPRFARELGVLFQIVDDILDVTGTDADLGKPSGQRRAPRQAHLRDRVRAAWRARSGASLTGEGARLAGARRAAGGAASSSRSPTSSPSARASADRATTGPSRTYRPLMTRLLDSIDRPQDLHGLSEEELRQVAQEVREHIIDTVGEIGGHFGANLGTCELAVALHSLLDSPRDKILWDVGHQAYPHKVLTGRRDQLATIRQYEGLAPFCSIAESEHDIMGAGHASTSIGYARRAQGGHAAARHAGRRQGLRGHRRRRDDRRRRVRGDPPGRRPGHADRRRPQRQRHVDRAERRRAVALLQPRPPEPALLARARGRRGQARLAARRHRRALRAPRPAAQGVDQGVLGAGPLLGGARLGLHGRHRRPRRRARCAAR